MAPYQYSKLEDELRDIRLLLLRPGQFDDDLRAVVSIVSLIEPVSLPSRRLSLRELRTTLPAGWQVFETVEGRYIFEHPVSGLTTWVHSDPNISALAYETVGDAPYGTFRPRYEALSYTWGTTNNPTFLYVESDDPKAPPSTIEIQQNLASALKHLRLPDETRTLWVDAVCINQNSIAERNTQVTRMTSIYRCAYSVIAWLGPKSLESKVALSALDQIGSQTELTKCVRRLRTPEAAHPDWFLSGSTLPYGDDIWRAILDVVSRSWFDRVWVVQEVQLANPTATLQCGYDSIRWGRFRRAAWCILRKRSPPYLPLAHRLAAIKVLVASLEGLNFRHLLYGSSTRLCSDQRDHIYGLLGLASPAILRQIQPQYVSDVGTVYTTAFLAILRRSRRLDALEDCGLGPERSGLRQLPSWVPNWSAPIEEQVGVLNSLYSGSGISCAQATFHPPNVLEVTGVPSGTVHLVKGPVPKDNREILEAIWKWAPKDIQSGVYPTEESALTAYALGLSLGMVRDRFPAAEGLLPTLRELEMELKSFAEPSQCPVDRSPPGAFRQMLGNPKGRLFVVTKNGYFGLGPPKTEPGKDAALKLAIETLRPLR
jgi:Heterokaryon incompatibility protein (HET)